MSYPAIAIVSPCFHIGGGGTEGVIAGMLEAFKRDYTVYFISIDKINLELLNETYVTNIKENEIKIIQVDVPNWLKDKFALLRWALLVRFCKRIAAQFELMISAYNIMYFGKKGIQYIGDFSFDDRLRYPIGSWSRGLMRFFYRDSILRWIYLKLCELIAGTSKDDQWKNLTITNSRWSKEVIKNVFGIEAKLIYPPVVSPSINIPWEKRENGFVSLSRISPEKNIDKIIDILNKVRKRRQDIHLHILGRIDDANYYEYLKKLCEGNESWIFMEGLVIGNKKIEYLHQHKFGISARTYEPFGIAIAEMVKSGCVVWAPKGGGQQEIVNHPDLIYTDIDDAANKIEEVLRNEGMQLNLRNHLAEQSKKFSSEKFMAEIRKVVNEFFKQNQFS